ncbi:hypothetical protein BASA61_004341 [Batrachochytrium salamandrivorans]|nr:hypothetical protein BASA61_004341 [Batrachochytrium salamandrivorans]
MTGVLRPALRQPLSSETINPGSKSTLSRNQLPIPESSRYPPSEGVSHDGAKNEQIDRTNTKRNSLLTANLKEGSLSSIGSPENSTTNFRPVSFNSGIDQLSTEIGPLTPGHTTLVKTSDSSLPVVLKRGRKITRMLGINKIRSYGKSLSSTRQTESESVISQSTLNSNSTPLSILRDTHASSHETNDPRFTNTVSFEDGVSITDFKQSKESVEKTRSSVSDDLGSLRGEIDQHHNDSASNKLLTGSGMTLPDLSQETVAINELRENAPELESESRHHKSPENLIKRSCKNISHLLKFNGKSNSKNSLEETKSRCNSTASSSSTNPCDNSQCDTTDASNECAYSHCLPSFAEDADFLTLDGHNEMQTIFKGSKKSECDHSEVCKQTPHKSFASYFQSRGSTSQLKPNTSLMTEEPCDDPTLQEALSIIRKHMESSLKQESSQQLKTYNESVKNVRKLMKNAKTKFRSTVKSVGHVSSWAGSRYKNKGKAMNDPGFNVFVDSVERRLLMEEEQEHLEMINRNCQMTVQQMTIEPVCILKYGGAIATNPKGLNNDTNYLQGLKGEQISSNNSVSLSDQINKKAGYRYCDIDGGEDSRESLLNHDYANRTAQKVQESEATLAYISPRGSLSVPITDSRHSNGISRPSLRSEKVIRDPVRLSDTNKSKLSLPSLDQFGNPVLKTSDAAAHMNDKSIEALKSHDTVNLQSDDYNLNLMEKSNVLLENCQESPTPLLSTFVPAPSDYQPGVDVDTLLVKILGDDDFKRTLIGTHLFNREAHPGLFGEDEGGPLMPEHTKLYPLDSNDKSEQYDSEMDNESVGSFMDHGPTWFDFYHFSHRLEPFEEVPNSTLEEDPDAVDMTNHPLQRSNSETCDLFELELLFEQHRRRNREMYKSGQYTISSKSEHSNISCGATETASLPTSEFHVGPAQLFEVSLAADAYLNSPRKDPNNRHVGRSQSPVSGGVPIPSLPHYTITKSASAMESLVAKRNRNCAGMQSIDNFLSSQAVAFSPDNVPEHTWDDLAGVTPLSKNSEFRSLIGYIFGYQGNSTTDPHHTDTVLVNGVGADEMIPLDDGQLENSDSESATTESHGEIRQYTYEEVWPTTDDVIRVCQELDSSSSLDISETLVVPAGENTEQVASH